MKGSDKPATKKAGLQRLAMVNKCIVNGDELNINQVVQMKKKTSTVSNMSNVSEKERAALPKKSKTAGLWNFKWFGAKDSKKEESKSKETPEISSREVTFGPSVDEKQ